MKVFTFRMLPVVVHKDLAHYFGFTTDTEMQEARHAFESAMVRAFKQVGGTQPTGRVLRGDDYREFNLEVKRASGQRLPGHAVRIYSANEVILIYKALRGPIIPADVAALLSVAATVEPVVVDDELLDTLEAQGPVPRAPETTPVIVPEVIRGASEEDQSDALALTELLFDGDRLECTAIGGEGYVALPSLCRVFEKEAKDNFTLLDGWARTRLGRVRDAAGRAKADVTLLHVDDALLFVARLNSRGMSSDMVHKHRRYLRECSAALTEHFKRRYGIGRTEEPRPPVVAPPRVAVASPSTPQSAPAPADLGAVDGVLQRWTARGLLSAERADRYLADFVQRNGILDLENEPPALPPMLLGKQTPTAESPPPPPVPTPAAKTGFDAAKMVATLSKNKTGPAYPVKSIQQVEEVINNGNYKASIQAGYDASELERIARDLGIWEHPMWGAVRKDEPKTWCLDQTAIEVLTKVVRFKMAATNGRIYAPDPVVEH